MHVQRFSVAFDYPVVFSHDVLDPSNDALAWCIARREPRRVHRCLVVVDDGVAGAWPGLNSALEAYLAQRPELELAGPVLRVPGGEPVKNDTAAVETLHRAIVDHGIDRHAVVVAIGGGAVLDAVGFAASTAHRGVRLVRLPTTVLAQNDAGVGVKNGINALGSKNFLGSFAPPHAVLNDSRWLTTLPRRDRVAGAAEAVKVGLIRDREFFEWLERNASAIAGAEPDAMATMIRRCADLHLEHIRRSGDPFEMGSARPLDYGHWAAHKLEMLSEHALRHGEAVAIGMLLDAHYATLRGQLGEAELRRITSTLQALGLPCWHPALDIQDGSKRAVLRGLDEFREHLGGELTVTLLRDIGDAHEVHTIDTAMVERAVERLRDAHSTATPGGGS